MVEMATIPVRIPEDLLQQADDLIPAIQGDHHLHAVAGRISRSSVLRLAIVEGIGVLRKRYSDKKNK